MTDLEYDADGWVAVDLQDDAGLGKGTKPPQCCFEPVGTYREIRHSVGTRFVGDRASADPGIGCVAVTSTPTAQISGTVKDQSGAVLPAVPRRAFD